MRSPIQGPGALFAAMLFFILLVFLFIFVQVGIVTAAFSKLGLTTMQGFAVLVATLFGSRINIPLYKTGRLVRVLRPGAGNFFFGPFRGSFRQGGFGPNGSPFSQDPFTQEPETELKEQVVAANVGGCIIPCLLSLYIYFHLSEDVAQSAGLNLWLGVAVVIVSAVCFRLARPVAGVGISIPVLIPPLVTALTALILVPHEIAPHVAYIAGSLGTLVGADLLHLLNPRTMDGLQAETLAIGGAGTFDGIFITGILAVLFA